MEWTSSQEATLAVGALALFAAVVLAATIFIRRKLRRWE